MYLVQDRKWFFDRGSNRRRRRLQIFQKKIQSLENKCKVVDLLVQKLLNVTLDRYRLMNTFLHTKQT